MTVLAWDAAGAGWLAIAAQIAAAGAMRSRSRISAPFTAVRSGAAGVQTRSAGLLQEEQAELVIGELAALGEQEVRDDVAARAGEASAPAGDLEHGRPVLAAGVG